MRRMALFAGLLVTATVGATTVVSMNLESLTAFADVVARGTVKSMSARWTQDKLRIITDVEIELSQVLKGDEKPHTITVMYPGGVVGDIGQRVEGVPQFSVDEEVVVFLDRKGTERFAVTGMAQGKFSLRKGSDGRLMAIPDDRGHLLMLDPVTRQPTRERQGPMAFEELVSRVFKASGKTVEKPVPSKLTPKKSVP